MKAQRTGSMTLNLDPDAWSRLMGAQPPSKPERRGVRLEALEPIPRPSPWSHPLAWLRWNPLIRTRFVAVLPNCEVEPQGDGSIRVTAHRSEPDPDTYWEFQG